MTLNTGASYLTTRVKGFPKELIVTFWLQVALLATAAASVESAGWVETPSLVLAAFLAALTAALLVHFGGGRKVHHLWVVLAGGLFAYLGAIYLTEADQWYLRFSVLHSRIAQWWAVVIGEDVTTDTLPLSIMLMAITWVAAYFTSWGLFRYQNVWATLLPIGAGTVINLTYLPDQFSVYLSVFLIISLLMLVQVTSLKQRALLQSTGVPHPPSFYLWSLAHGLWLIVIILGIAVAFPIGYFLAAPLESVFRLVDRPVDRLQEELYRIFAGVPTHNPSSSLSFRSVLPMIRNEPKGDFPVFFTNSSRPLYWSAIAYDKYTSKVWHVGTTEFRPLVSFSGDEEESRLPYDVESIDYAVHMYVDSPYLLVAGVPFEVYPSAQQQALASPTYRVDLVTPQQNSGDLPPDLQSWAHFISAAAKDGGSLKMWQLPSGLVVTKVIKQLPAQEGRTVIDIKPDSGTYYSNLIQAVNSAGRTVAVEGKGDIRGLSAVSYKPVERLRANSEYQVLSVLKSSSEEALRNDTEQYPAGLLDRYLQIPSILPPRVSVLASDIVSGASNPYDKAIAIESYLRALEYTVAPQSIPYDADTVDYFLFESGKGYSDYFASAMAIMLRTQGVPTRLVSGYGPGKEDPDLRGFLIRNNDRHSWPEVYFSNIGWVPFEPTPSYETRPRGLPANLSGMGDQLAEQSARDEKGAVIDLLERLEPEGEGKGHSPERYFGTPLGMGGALFALFLLMGAILMRTLWVRQYGGLGSPNAVYERMHRLVTFLGFPSSSSQTAYEFSHDLSQLIPETGAEVDFVSQAFVRQRYGAIMPSPSEEMQLTWAWRRIKRALTTLSRHAF